MSNNFRAVQPLGDRIVLYNVNPYEKFIADDIVENNKLMKDIEEVLAESEKRLEEAVESTNVHKN